MRKQIFPLLAVVLLCGCMNEAAKQTLDEYSRALERAQELEHLVSTADFSVFTGKELIELYEISSGLYYDYDPMALKEEQRAACEELKTRIAKLRAEIPQKAKEQIHRLRVTP